MNQAEKRVFLIQKLLDEDSRYRDLSIPAESGEQKRLLASCYRSCLELAERNGVESIAFCCISTGVFHFPHQRAAEIAVETVRRYKAESNSAMKAIFNVFKDTDREIYRRLLAG